MLIPVVMAGGSGTRLWPLSRKLFPKQFLPLISKDSMLQATLNRLGGLDLAEPIIICNEEHRFIVAEQLRKLGELGKIILEPMGRNTAPAVALSALVASSLGDDPLLLVLAADHVIEDEKAFQEAIVKGVDLAQQGKLVTFGIVPQSAHTGYGYIKQGEALDDSAFSVVSFVEKPSAELATQYVNSKEYLWNSGMFLFKASSYLKALEQHRPDILEACKASMNSIEDDLDFVRVDPVEFEKCDDESIDYAVMEPLCAQNNNSVAVVPLDAGWNDVGSWASLQELADKDENGNHLHGDVIAHNTTNTYVRGDKKLITTLGVENLVIVDTPDALLVSSIDASQDVKEIVNQLKADNRPEATIHREVYRPWGKYDSIDNGERYQVKCITVKPGAKLSVQMHHHRAEHWIVVSGCAKVTNGDKIFLLTENQSTYIPIGEIHALENPGKVSLELIEIQSGGYLGEDDIVRFEDIYGRTDKKNIKD
ncbi:mannose-1-phosphate guanylyltransferase/mannose-6-phosphate isomerase [Gammaproteobacteria bacterium AS21]